MSEVLSVEDYLKLTKKEKVALYKAREAEEMRLADEDMERDLEHEPATLKEVSDHYKYMQKQVISPCHWVGDEELRAAAAAMNVSPYRCPHFDRDLFQCTEFADGWLDCEEIALKIKLAKHNDGKQ